MRLRSRRSSDRKPAGTTFRATGARLGLANFQAEGASDSVDAILRDVSVQALLSVRRSNYWQDAAFAVGLGVGVSAPEHTSLPRLADG